MRHLKLARSLVVVVVLAVAALAAAQPIVPGAQASEQPGIVTGVLRSGGLPIAGLPIALTSTDQAIPNWPGNAQNRTDNSGRFRFPRVPPGRYYIVMGRNDSPLFHPGVTDVSAATIIQVVAGATTEVPDMVPGKAVSGRVVDTDRGVGRRIENLVLCCDYAWPVVYREGAAKTGTPFVATLSDDGQFLFPFVPPGNYALTAIDRNIGPISWALAVGANGISELQLDVTEGVDVLGTILDQRGIPITATVQLLPKPMNSVFDTLGPAIRTSIAMPPFEPARTAGGGSHIVLRQIMIHKANPSLDEVQNWILERAGTLERSATSGANGRFAFRSVYPGTFVLEVKSGNMALRQEIQVGSEGLTNVTFQVPALQVTGRVIAANGVALPSLNYVRVVRNGSDTDVFYGFPDSEGHFSLILVPGEYRVFTERLGAPVQSISDISGDITNAAFTVEPGRGPQIVVTLAP